MKYLPEKAFSSKPASESPSPHNSLHGGLEGKTAEAHTLATDREANSLSSIIFSELKLAPLPSDRPAAAAAADAQGDSSQASHARGGEEQPHRGAVNTPTDLENLTYLDYAHGNHRDGDVSIPVPFVDTHYDSSGDDEEDEGVGGTRARKKSSFVHRAASLRSSKPNLIGSIQMEDYFIRSALFGDAEMEMRTRSDVASKSLMGGNSVPSYASAIDADGPPPPQPQSGTAHLLGDIPLSYSDHNSDLSLSKSDDVLYPVSMVSSLDIDEEQDLSPSFHIPADGATVQSQMEDNGGESIFNLT
jgi:hypothetical protein